MTGGCALTVVSVLAVLAAGCGSGTHATRPSTRTSGTTKSAPRGTEPAARAHGPGLALRASETSWQLPAPVYRTVAVARGQRIFVLGGHDVAGDTTSNVDELNVDTGAARVAGTLAAPTHGSAAATLGRRLLVFGGAGSAVHDLVQQFEPRWHTARVIARLPRPRADVTAAVVGHTVVLIGGFDGIGPQRDVWASGDGRHFHVIAKLPQAVRYAAVVANGDSVYVLGGLISGSEYHGRFSDLVQRVDIRDQNARVVGRLPTPLAHAMGALVAGRVLVMGGSTPTGSSAAILRFYPASGRVSRAGRLPHPLTDAAVATTDDRAYLLGGISTRPLAGVIVVRLAKTSAGVASASTRSVCPMIAAHIQVAAGAVSLASGDGALWVAGFGAVSRLNPTSGCLIAEIRTLGSDDHSQIAVGKRAVWVTSTGRGAVDRINPATERVTAAIHLGGSPQGIAVGGGRVWITLALPGPGRLIALDPRTDRGGGPAIRVGPGPGPVVYGQHAVWVQNTSPASVMRINPANGQVKTVIGAAPLAPGSPGPGAIAVGYGSLWSVANGTLTRVAPGSGRAIASIQVPRAVAIALGDHEVWVLSYPRSSSATLFEPNKHTAVVREIDPRSARMIGTPIRLRALQPIAVITTRHSLWVANFPGTVTRFRLVACHAHSRRARRATP